MITSRQLSDENKTIIGLKLLSPAPNMTGNTDENKTIIGLKYCL